MIRKIYTETGKTTEYPIKPVMSRFVSPWDTSGWYSVLPNFSKGCKVYSNSNETVESCPTELENAEYIMTFNSFADGFDDKQEVDFYVEQDSIVYVCFDNRIGSFPSFTSDFEKTSMEIELSGGLKYTVFEKEYSDGDQVHIPGITGECNHFFVLAKPKFVDNTTKELTAVPKQSSSLPANKRKVYTYYINEVFNSEESIGTFLVHGDIKIENDDNNTYGVMYNNSSIRRKLFGNNVICEATVIPVLSEGSYTLCSFVDDEENTIASFTINNGKLTASTNVSSKDITKVTFNKELVLSLNYNEEEQTASFKVNSVDTGIVLKAKGKIDSICFSSENGVLKIDDIKAFDNTETYIVNETGISLKPSSFESTANALVKNVPIPFKKRPSISLTSKNDECASTVYNFNSISGVGSVEVKVKATTRDMCKISLGNNDEELCSVALYMNNLYVSDGTTWKRVFAGLTDWMYYPCKNQFLIKVSFNTERGTFDVWVDGACRATNFKLTNTTAISNVGFTTAPNSEILIGKIKVYDCVDFSRGLIPCGKVFDVKKAPYNAVGDGVTLDTEKIQQALDDAAFTGGTVLIDDGTFLCGELFLRSDETVFVTPKATIIGTQDHSQYPLKEPRSSLCAHRQLGRGLLYGEDIKNITVTGGGMLDGNGLYRFKMNDPINDNRVDDARPDIVYITYSRHINVSNINFKSSCFWTVVPLSSGNVTLHNLNLDCMNTPNRDGIDPVDCHDITVSGCCIMAGDDGLCFKSSDPVGCYNIDVHDMMIQSLASGIKFGTDTYYSLTDAKFVDCTVKNVQRCGVSLETVDGALVKNVIFERIDMADVSAPVYVCVGARNRLPRGIDVVRTSKINKVTFKDIRFEDAYPFSYTKEIRESIVCGQSPTQCIDGITFDGMYLELFGGSNEVPGCLKTIDNKYPEYDRHGLSGGHAFAFRFCKHIKIKRCKVILKSPDVRPLVAYYDCD